MSHAWRPLFLVLLLVAGVLTARAFVVPKDFMAKNGDYKYQWHRVGNEEDWKNFSVKYKGREFCSQCHPDHITKVTASKHAMVQCENCHVQVDAKKASHPVDLKEAFQYPLSLGIDRSRDLCLRCHAKLPYRPAVYTQLAEGPIPMKMQDGEQHNPGVECVTCHDVHSAGFKF
ncbi:MAG: cytochrome C [Nitrospirales bacterium]|nr:cytochrome C [Nitrospirales bacterium]